MDTNAFLWWISGDPMLSAVARSAIISPESNLSLSVVSAWEIGIKYRIGRLALPERPDVYVPRHRVQHGIAILELDEACAVYDPLLPPIHRDPFDRMLVCQALVHGLTILTPDRAIRDYPVRTAW